MRLRDAGASGCLTHRSPSVLLDALPSTWLGLNDIPGLRYGPANRGARGPDGRTHGVLFFEQLGAHLCARRSFRACCRRSGERGRFQLTLPGGRFQLALPGGWPGVRLATPSPMHSSLQSWTPGIRSGRKCGTLLFMRSSVEASSSQPNRPTLASPERAASATPAGASSLLKPAPLRHKLPAMPPNHSQIPSSAQLKWQTV